MLIEKLDLARIYVEGCNDEGETNIPNIVYIFNQSINQATYLPKVNSLNSPQLRSRKSYVKHFT